MITNITSSVTTKRVRSLSRGLFIVSMLFFVAAPLAFIYDRFAADELNVSVYLHAIGAVLYAWYYHRFRCPNCKLRLGGIWSNAACGCCGHAWTI